MFNDKKGSPNQIGERNTIAKNTSLVGDINSDGDFRVDGKIEGTIKTSGRGLRKEPSRDCRDLQKEEE